MGSVFFVVGPVRGENLVGLAAEQEVEFLLEDAVELFAELLLEIGHHPAAELEALGRILGRPAGRLHDAIHGNLGADDNLQHGSSISAAGVHPAPSPGSRTGRTEFDSDQEILSQLLTLLLSVSAWPSR